jgi:hypothetical protein
VGNGGNHRGQIREPGPHTRPRRRQTWTETDNDTMRWLDLKSASYKPGKDSEPLMYDDEPYKSELSAKDKKRKDEELLYLAQARVPSVFSV